MREIKVQCDCGQRYKFEVEPVNGQMPYSIACPVCGLDGTAQANQLLRQPPTPAPIAVAPTPAAPVPPASAAPVPLSPVIPAAGPIVLQSVAASAPAPAAVPLASNLAVSAGEPPAPPPPPAPVSAAPAAATERPRLRINRHVEPEAAAAPPPPPPPGPGLTVASGSASTRRAPATVRAPSLVAEPEKQGNFWLGFLGAILGAAIGGAIYYVLFMYTGFQVKLIAIGVGGLAGLGAWLLGKPGSNELGVITATLSLVALVGAQYFVVHAWWMEDVTNETEVSYESRVVEARELMAAIPNGTDEEIRTYIANEYFEEEGEKMNMAWITPEVIQEFRNDTYSEARDLANGTITKEQYEITHQEEIAAVKKDVEEEEGTFKAVFIIFLLSKFNLISCAAAAGLAYKISA